jgi:hypothetical protein
MTRVMFDQRSHAFLPPSAGWRIPSTRTRRSRPLCEWQSPSEMVSSPWSPWECIAGYILTATHLQGKGCRCASIDECIEVRSHPGNSPKRATQRVNCRYGSLQSGKGQEVL